MFCYQCEQTAKGTGCTAFGVCGKDPEAAALQDLLNHAATGIAQYAGRAAKLGARQRDIDVAVIEALFSTVTNVNFDAARLADQVRALARRRDEARALYEQAAAKAGVKPEVPGGAAAWKPAADLVGLLRQAEAVGIDKRQAAIGETLAGLQELVLYGLKGMCAYVDHAQILGHEDPAVYAFVHDTLTALAEQAPAVNDLVALALKVGEVNLKVMGLLDAANTGAYGHPEPTPIRISAVRGKAILVSGHDLKDLYELLRQTEGTGINVYTHGEMLPANAYPKLKAFKHLVGNYGGAWQDQRKEFDAFPGAILMTTNCIQKPAPSYQDRIFTAGLVAWPGVRHIADGNFKPLIDAALAAPGFAADEPERTILGGFGHQAVMNVAGAVVDAVKSGAVRHFFLIGGCDGAKPGRNYYTDLAQAVPQDCVILTLACGKFRFNKLDFGTVAGLPRLLDIGQCNDAYSAIQIAVALANAFNCGVNDLPLTMILSWYEQKAVAILLTLLHLGVKNMRLGPSLPAFLAPPVVQVLVDTFKLAPVSTTEADLKAILGGKVA
jgi:hydroxylamine reductase